MKRSRFTEEQILTLAEWYREIYSLDESSNIITSLPTGYNFSLIAGVIAAHFSKAMFQYVSQDGLLDTFHLLWPGDRNTVVLANPYTMRIIECASSSLNGVLVDTGGAPLASTRIKQMRSRGIDVREGYGLTETGSLTHFDIEGTDESLGTVGHARGAVQTSIDTADDKPRIVLCNAIVGGEIRPAGRPVAPSDKFITDDLGEIRTGRLRILGRASDCSVRGYWPRDILDLIGPQLRRTAAKVSQPDEESVHIILQDEFSENRLEAIQNTVLDFLGILPQIGFATGLTYSLKLI